MSGSFKKIEEQQAEGKNTFSTSQDIRYSSLSQGVEFIQNHNQEYLKYHFGGLEQQQQQQYSSKQIMIDSEVATPNSNQTKTYTKHLSYHNRIPSTPSQPNLKKLPLRGEKNNFFQIQKSPRTQVAYYTSTKSTREETKMIEQKANQTASNQRVSASEQYKSLKSSPQAALNTFNSKATLKKGSEETQQLFQNNLTKKTSAFVSDQPKGQLSSSQKDIHMHLSQSERVLPCAKVQNLHPQQQQQGSDRETSIFKSISMLQEANPSSSGVVQLSSRINRAAILKKSVDFDSQLEKLKEIKRNKSISGTTTLNGVNGLSSKQKISCDDACIPMNVVSQYNINDNVNLPQENLTQIVFNPYNFKLSSKFQLISLQNQIQDSKKKFISEDMMKISSSCCSPSSINNTNQIPQSHQQHFFQQHPLNKNKNKKTSCSYLPFQNSAIIDKMKERSQELQKQSSSSFTSSLQLAQPNKQYSQFAQSQSASQLKPSIFASKQKEEDLIKSQQQQFEEQNQQRILEMLHLKNNQIMNLTKVRAAYENGSSKEGSEKKQNIVRVLKSFTRNSKRFPSVVQNTDESLDQDDHLNLISPKHTTEGEDNMRLPIKNLYCLSHCPSSAIIDQTKPKSVLSSRNKQQLMNGYFHSNNQPDSSSYTPKEIFNSEQSKYSLLNKSKNKSYSLSTPTHVNIGNHNIVAEDFQSKEDEYEHYKSLKQKINDYNNQQHYFNSNCQPKSSLNDTPNCNKLTQKQSTLKQMIDKQQTSSSTSTPSESQNIFGSAKIIQLLQKIKCQQSTKQNYPQEDELFQQEQTNPNKIYEKIVYKSLNSHENQSTSYGQ